MTNLTRKEILNAYESLEELYDYAIVRAGIRAQTLRESITEVMPPKPEPTMKYIEWDTEEHYLAEAEHDIFGKVIMINQSPTTENIWIIIKNDCDTQCVETEPENLTLTGKRYTLMDIKND